MSMPGSSELLRTIDALGPWFHNLHLPGGVQTAPHHVLSDFPACKWQQLAPYLPADLHGWSVLDVGCNAGFYSFELARRGARVLGIDREPLYLRQACWAARQLGLEERVQFSELQVYDLMNFEQRFDLVLFMGVFYHLRHPLLALDILAARTRRLMVFQTMTMPGFEVATPPDDIPLLERSAMQERGFPVMAFVEKCVAGDMTNWWAPNHAAVLAMLRSSGLRVAALPGHEIYVCEPHDDGNEERAAIVRDELAAVAASRASLRARPSAP
jgi:tRNA (mo5U34)-methyltransferase